MTRQGCSTFSTDESNRILDRLAGLEKIITPERMMQALVATGRVNRHRCKLSHEVMLWVVLAMGLFTNVAIRQVFKHAQRMLPGQRTPSRSNLCEGRQRLGVEPVRRLFDLVVRPQATPATPGAFESVQLSQFSPYRRVTLSCTIFFCTLEEKPARFSFKVSREFGQMQSGCG